MTKKLVWRLGKLPSVEELRQLVTDKIVTQDEAREILFNQEDDVDRDKKSLESEIKFLRKLVEELAQNKNNLVTTIREIQKPYYDLTWYKPYDTWCGSYTYGQTTLTTNSNVSYGLVVDSSEPMGFTDIKTF